MTGHIDAVDRTVRHPGSSEPGSGVGVAPSVTAPGFIALSAVWSRSTYLELGALSSAVPCARLHTRQVLWEWGLGELAEVAELLVSELMTNACKATVEQHLGTPIRLRLSSNHDQVLIEVWDSDPTLSERWGCYRLRSWGGKVIWAEIGL